MQPNHENIFYNNFHNAAKHLKIFSFPKNSIFGKYLFSGKYFTWTKHSLNSSESDIVWHILTDVKHNSKISILGQKRSCILCNFHIFTVLNLIQIPQPNSLKTHSIASLANTWVEWLQAYIIYQIENNIPKMWSCPFNIFF